MIIRQENKEDHKIVFNIIKNAFKTEQYSDHKEHFLVERLRNSNAFVPELSRVAVENKQLVGHILLTKIKVANKFKEFTGLALAPVSVLPEYQKKGIGKKLIIDAHDIARKLGFKFIVLLGHEKYYPRFGYEPADKYNIQFPFDAPKQNCMVLALKKNALDEVNGTIVYPKEFNI